MVINMWKDDIKKQRSEEQQTNIDAMDFADTVLARIDTLLNRSRPQRDLNTEQRGEVRRFLKKLFLEAKQMTRCTLLDKWFDAESKRLDKEEEKQKKDLITGDKK